MFLSLCFLDPSLFHQPAIGGAGVQVQIVGAPTTFHHHGNTFFPHYCDTLTLGAHYSVRTMMATILFTHTTLVQLAGCSVCAISSIVVHAKLSVITWFGCTTAEDSKVCFPTHLYQHALEWWTVKLKRWSLPTKPWTMSSSLLTQPGLLTGLTGLSRLPSQVMMYSSR